MKPRSNCGAILTVYQKLKQATGDLAHEAGILGVIPCAASRDSNRRSKRLRKVFAESCASELAIGTAAERPARMVRKNHTRLSSGRVARWRCMGLDLDW